MKSAEVVQLLHEQAENSCGTEGEDVKSCPREVSALFRDMSTVQSSLEEETNLCKTPEQKRVLDDKGV